MLKLLIFSGIMIGIFIIAMVYIFRHELETIAHKYGVYDKTKRLKHEVKRKEITLNSYVKEYGHTVEAKMIQEEIRELENLINEKENKK